MGTVAIIIIIVLILIGIVSSIDVDNRPRNNKDIKQINYSKDYMNNPIVRDMNERDS